MRKILSAKEALLAGFAVLFLAFALVYPSRYGESATVAAPTGQNVNFPTGIGTYSVTTSKGPVTASFKFAPKIADIIFNEQNLGTHIGNRFKSIVWMPNGYPGGAGPAGRWDISDPWNPRDGGVVGLANGGSALAVGVQPANHRGPFNSGGYPHPPNLSSVHPGTLGELANGLGRFIFDSGEECGSNPDCRSITPVLSLAPGQGMSLGQLVDHPLFEGVSINGETEHEGRTVIDATASGKFFVYSGGGVDSSNLPRSLEIFDATNLTGSVAYASPRLKPFASEPWQNITELQIVAAPGVRNHFLIARSGGIDITEKPTFYIGEINADTGSIIRQNSFTLDLQGISYTAPYSPGPRVYPGSGLESATVNGKTYLFMNEKATRNSFDANALFSLKIGVYQFDPQALAFIRKGDVTLNNTPRIPLGCCGGRDVYFRIARAETGDAYPMLAAWSKYKEPILLKKMVINNNPTDIKTPQLYSIDLYGLKDIIDSPTVLSVTPAAADVSVPEDDFVRPLTIGQVEVAHYGFDASSIRGGSPNHLFLKKEAGKTNLYLYRKAFIFDGRAYGGSGGTYDTIRVGSDAAGDADHYYGPFTGPAALRVDKIDVSGFTGGTFTGGGGGTTTSTPSGPIPVLKGTACLARYQYLCDQVMQLTKKICALSPSFCEKQKETL